MGKRPLWEGRNIISDPLFPCPPVSNRYGSLPRIQELELGCLRLTRLGLPPRLAPMAAILYIKSNCDVRGMILWRLGRYAEAVPGVSRRRSRSRLGGLLEKPEH